MDRPTPNLKGQIASGAAAESFSFDEYKMYYESTEKTTDRRIALITTNTSLCLVVAAAIGVILARSFEKKELWHLTLPLVTIISLLAMSFCRWWSNALTSYKDLNAAKFEVLNKDGTRSSFPGEFLCGSIILPFRARVERIDSKEGVAKV